MNCHGTKHISLRWVACCALLGALLVMAPTAQAVVIVNDSFADGGRNNGADPLDSNWWTSSSLNGIEVSAGSLGMVTGSSGRGIHTVFPTQTLANVGDKLVATYTFRTPTNVGSGGAAGFRAGLFDTLGRAGLDADIEASSGTPNPLYGLFSTPTAALPGYMLDMDVGTGTEDINFRQHDIVPTAATPTGRLMGTTTGFTNIPPAVPDGVVCVRSQTRRTRAQLRSPEAERNRNATYRHVGCSDSHRDGRIRLGQLWHACILGQFKFVRSIEHSRRGQQRNRLLECENRVYSSARAGDDRFLRSVLDDGHRAEDVAATPLRCAAQNVDSKFQTE